MWKIYKITNLVNEKVYIGVTKNSLDLRFKQHARRPHARGWASRLKNSILKHGRDNFTIALLEEVDSIEEANRQEVYFIAHYGSLDPTKGYNIREGGLERRSPTKNQAHRDAISEAVRRKYLDPEYRQRVREGLSRSRKSKSGRTTTHQENLNARLRSEEVKSRIASIRTGIDFDRGLFLSSEDWRPNSAIRKIIKREFLSAKSVNAALSHLETELPQIERAKIRSIILSAIKGESLIRY